MMRHGRIIAAGIFAAALVAAAGMAQEPGKVKWDEERGKLTVKDTGEKVKIKKSGSKYKVKETGEKFKVKETRAGEKVKGTSVKIKSSKPVAHAASKSVAPGITPASTTPQLPRAQVTPAESAPAPVAGAGEIPAPEAR